MTKVATRRLTVPIRDFAAVVHEFDLVSRHSLEEYRSGVYVRRAAERLVQLACDLACEINCIMLIRAKVRPPEGFEESFRAMAGEGLLPAPLAEKMLSVVALRHKLIYGTDPDGDEQVHRRLPFFAVLLREYGRHIEEVLEGMGGAG